MVASSGASSSHGAPVRALSFTNLSKVFGGTRALDKVDFHVDAGEICGLVGRNGSGKSTLIQILSGYHDPEPGASLSIGGEPVSLPLHPAQLDGLGLRFVHQDLGLSPAATVLENIRIT